MEVKKSPMRLVLPSTFVPSNPPQIIQCAPVESNFKTAPVTMIWAFESQPPIPVLLDSLAAVLNNYPVLCASLHEDERGNLALHLDNQNPVAFIEANSSARLENCIPSPSQRYSSTLLSYDTSTIPKDLFMPVTYDWSGPALYLQWTKLACGGCFLGVSGFHVIDAQAASTFVTEWGRYACAQKDTYATLKPLHEPSFSRSFMINGMEDAVRTHPITDCVYTAPTPSQEPVQQTVPETEPAPTIVSRVYHFPRKELEAIKRAASSPSVTISAYDALYAHMTQVICKATNTTSNDPVLVCQAFNGRNALGQPQFFGSAAFWLSYRSTYTDILSSLPATALAIHDSHSSQTSNSLLAFNGFLASFPKYSDISLSARITTHDLHTASWRGCGLLNMDFGLGKPVFMGPAAQYATPATRYMIFMDTPQGTEGEGGIDVSLALAEPHWKQMMEQGNLHMFAN